ncbi:hypothetical protein DL98DRAFT_639533 [Cadophora sp. DSE1049]|nr:hypothetical protein DL98DRAFT_639533 [Cadophora sp. DSE1049]
MSSAIKTSPSLPNDSETDHEANNKFRPQANLIDTDDEARSVKSEASTSSVFSLADSTFSLASKSSMSSVMNSGDAGERLLALLLQDEKLRPVYIDGLETMPVHKFERNLRRLLKLFAVDLKLEAETSEQTHATRFVGYQARNSAQLICSILSKEDKGKARQAELDHPSPDDEEDFLDDEDRIFGDVGVGEPDAETNLLLELEAFILRSKAFKGYRESLKEFVQAVRKVDGGMEIQILEGSPNEDEKGDLNDASHQGLRESLADDSPARGLVTPSNSWCFESISDYCRIHSSYIRGLMLGTEKQELPTGKTSIEWRCKCGTQIRDGKANCRYRLRRSCTVWLPLGGRLIRNKPASCTPRSDLCLHRHPTEILWMVESPKLEAVDLAFLLAGKFLPKESKIGGVPAFHPTITNRLPYQRAFITGIVAQ